MLFVAKRLTRSDLTFFEAQFRKVEAGGQKSINLNRNVFIDQMYPSFPSLAGGKAKPFPLSLRIYGPDGQSQAHQVMRKIIAAGDKQKNWRLNGETVKEPDGGTDPKRYDDLQPDDYVILGFDGEVIPDRADLYVVSRQGPQDGMPSKDVPVHAELKAIMGDSVMMVLREPELDRISRSAPSGHPVRDLYDPDAEETLVEAARGSKAALERLSRRSVRRQSAEDLQKALQNIAAIGRDGEILVITFLKERAAADGISDIVWESDANAVNPWDITVTWDGGRIERAEVKTTKGPHSRPFHVSEAEIASAIDAGTVETQIWRVSRLEKDGGQLRRSTNFPEVARRVRKVATGFDQGITADGWLIDPVTLDWADVEEMTNDNEQEE